MFDPKLAIGDVVKNQEIVDIFKCGNMGGMRRSKTTNTLVIISDYTKGIYHDKWIGGVLHYTGMGKSGDQDIEWAQNATLAECNINNVDVHLFEVIDPGEYTYCGRIELVDKPYTEIQPGEDGIDRSVWMFPVRPVPDNDVIKPFMFVFKDMEDYKTHGADVEVRYEQYLRKKREQEKNNSLNSVTAIKKKPGLKEKIYIPADIIGKRVNHKSFGIGTISEICDTSIIVDFDNAGRKKLGYGVCINNSLLFFIN